MHSASCLALAILPSVAAGLALGDTPPFSFRYGGGPAPIATWTYKGVGRALPSLPRSHGSPGKGIAQWTDPATGLRVSMEIVGYRGGARDWRLQ